MKSSDIKTGGYYHDGKLGVREVVSTAGGSGGDTKVTYRILAAKVMREYSNTEKQMVSVVGTTGSCNLVSFASWAKFQLTQQDCDDLLAALAAKRIKLAPGEATFMASVASEFSGLEIPERAGAELSFDPDETRSAKGVGKKGLVGVNLSARGEGGTFTLTSLGAAWIRNHLAALAS